MLRAMATLPLMVSQAPIPANSYARFPVVVGSPVDSCSISRLDLFPGDEAPADADNYMVCELVEEDGAGSPAVTLAHFTTSTVDWERGAIAATWYAPPGYELAANHSIVARWDLVGSGQPVPGCMWRVTP
jgi:hypothetical protein